MNINNLAAYLAVDAVAAVGGTWLAKKEDLPPANGPKSATGAGKPSISWPRSAASTSSTKSLSRARQAACGFAAERFVSLLAAGV